MTTANMAATYIAIISAFVGLLSAFMSIISYYQSVHIHSTNRCERFNSKFRQNLDDCYMAVNDFVSQFSGVPESIKKRVSRDKILYLIETLRVDIEKNDLLTASTKTYFNDLEMRFSDITYEVNFEKITHDLARIKSSIGSLKRLLY